MTRKLLTYIASLYLATSFAHGAGIVKEAERYDLFGGFMRDHGNEFGGLICYYSENLVNRDFERLLLPVQKDRILVPDRVGENFHSQSKTATYGGADNYVTVQKSPDLRMSGTNQPPVDDPAYSQIKTSHQ